MSDGILDAAGRGQERSMELMDKLIGVAQAGSVFGQPVVSGEHTVITASEITVGIGFGYGIGNQPGGGEMEAEEAGGGSAQTGGGGGGGGAAGRPVAVISIGPGGVKVEPVVDPTKIALALFTTLGSMFMMLWRMRRSACK